MKKSTGICLFLILIALFLSLSLFFNSIERTAILKHEKSISVKNTNQTEQGRFNILEEFKPFDTSKNNQRWQIIQDRNTLKCYLSSGRTQYAGYSISPFDCPTDTKTAQTENN